MEELQKLIDLLKVEKEKAQRKDAENFVDGCMQQSAYQNGKSDAFSFAIDEAEKLLKTGREQQP